MRGSFFGILAVLALTPQIASAESSADPVARAKAEIERDCSTVEYPDEFAIVRDLTGDGLNDYLISYAVACDGTHSVYCGSAGCRTEIWIATEPRDWTLVFSDNAQGVELVDVKGAPAISIGQHGIWCGRIGADTCVSVRRWNGEALEILSANHPAPNSTGDSQ